MIASCAETVVRVGRFGPAISTSMQSILSTYQLHGKLGEGGMGVVYGATNVSTGRRCAIKRSRPEFACDPHGAERFLREAKALRRVRHRYVVQHLDDGLADDGLPFIAMEHVPGRNLDEIVRRRGPLGVERVLAVLRQASCALGAAHASGVIHNDVTPANLMSSSVGRRFGVVKLIDFGLARAADGGDEGVHPQANSSFSGSPLYAAPESYGGAVEERSDIYAIGATVYYLLAGRPVFDERRPLAAILAHQNRSPAPLRQLRNDIPSRLEEIVMRCLEKNPGDRFHTAAELHASLPTGDCSQV